MMKQIIFYISLFSLILMGCERNITTYDESTITYFADLELLGDVDLVLEVGTPFVEPGYIATISGKDVKDQVVVTSDVDVETAGIYSIDYQVTNADGFSVSATRNVYVADPTPSVISTGIHTTAEGTQRLWISSGAIVPFSGFKIIILQTEPGVFYISDFMGGYYDQRVGYGPNYAMTGYFKLNEDNTISAISSLVPGWGDSLDELINSSVDPETGKIKYDLSYAGLMTYTIIIN